MGEGGDCNIESSQVAMYPLARLLPPKTVTRKESLIPYAMLLPSQLILRMPRLARCATPACASVT